MNKIICFYLPQYYPSETNDKWFGKGFTEWTNVAKAKPLFRGHYQPKIPADLGFYDLRVPEVHLQQIKLAKEAGVYGFCYYHYWFGEGRMELDMPFKKILKLDTDFPFCLCWANQSWYSKFWNKDAECEHKLIIEQKYDNEEWIEKHFNSLLDAFKDNRYIKVDGKPLFMIYRPHEYPEVYSFMEKWNELAIKNGLLGIYFVAQATNNEDCCEFLAKGFDGVNIVRKDDYLNKWRYSNLFVKCYNKLLRALGRAPYHYNYADISSTFVEKNGLESHEANVFPTIIPNWDHSPRSGKRGSVFYNSTPENFEKHLAEVLNTVYKKGGGLIFLKSWNEWGEGNYIEPDLKYGHGYLDVLSKYKNG